MTIVFPTTSDTKLAAFVLEQDFRSSEWGVVTQVFDAVVRIVCAPDFNCAEVRLKSFSDILLFAGNESRRTIVQKAEKSLTSRHFQTQPAPGGIPTTVLQCAFDYIGDIATSVVGDVEDDMWLPAGESWKSSHSKLLKRWLSHFPSVRLVHSTWYAASLRIFGRSFRVKGPERHRLGKRRKVAYSILKKISSSCYGDWSRHANVDYDSMEEIDVQLTSYPFTEKTRNLTSLNIHAQMYQGWESELRGLLEVISALSNLELLCLFASLPNGSQLDRIADVLRPPRLRRLLFQVTAFNPTAHAVPLVNSLIGIPTLREIQVRCASYPMFGTIAAMQWTRAYPSDTVVGSSILNGQTSYAAVKEFRLTHLDIFDSINLMAPDAYKVLYEGALASASSLKISADMLESYGIEIIPFSTSLHELHLHSADTNTEIPFEFPEMNLPLLSRVYVQFDIKCFFSRPEDFQVWDGSFAVLVEYNIASTAEWFLASESRLPKLREVNIRMLVYCPIEAWDESDRSEEWVGAMAYVENTRKDLEKTWERRGPAGNAVTFTNSIEWYPVTEVF